MSKGMVIMLLDEVLLNWYCMNKYVKKYRTVRGRDVSL